MQQPHPLLITLTAIARLERRGGVRDPRLTQTDFALWQRFRRRLGWKDFVAILHEDLAGPFPRPFDLRLWANDPLQGVDDAVAKGLIEQSLAEDSRDSLTFIKYTANVLGVAYAANLENAGQIEPHHRVLELPGSGGTIAARLATADKGLSFDTQFTFVADSDEERLLIGLAAVELRTNAPRIIDSTEAKQRMQASDQFDVVLGLASSPTAVAFAAKGAKLL